MRKWGYLVEADAKSRQLLKQFRSTKSLEDEIAWLTSEIRSGNTKLHASLLKAQARQLGPRSIEIDDERDEIEESAGRALFVFAWADAEERNDRPASFGGDYMDLAPATPRRAIRSGKALIKAIETNNRPFNINQLYWVAENMPGRHRRTPTAEDFGHYLAAEALGHGVSWTDNHPDPEITVPHWDFDLLESSILDESGFNIHYDLESAIKYGNLRPRNHNIKPDVVDVKITKRTVQILIAGSVNLDAMNELLERRYGLTFVSSARGRMLPSITYYNYKKEQEQEEPVQYEPPPTVARPFANPRTPRERAADQAYKRKKRP